MTILSDVDIQKEMGINILIYPFFRRNLRGASYNLTASKLAWDLSGRTSIYDPSNGRITIKKQSIALLETNESIWVSNKIAGTYHSKVALVSKGLSHIGTTLDPEYIGSSLIAIRNHSDQDIILNAERDTFVTLVFHYISTEASIQPGNLPGRQDLLQGFPLQQEEREWLDEDFRKTLDALKLKVKESPDFSKIAELRKAEITKNSSVKRNIYIYTLLGVSFSALIVALSYLGSNKEQLSKQPWYDLSVNTVYTLLFAVPTAIAAKALNELK